MVNTCDKNEEKKEQNGYEADWQEFREFLEEWKEGTLTEDSPVFRLVTESSLTICRRNNCEAETDGIRQNCFLALARGQYRATASLKNYIYTILRHELAHRWKENSRLVRIEDLEDDIVDERSSALLEETLRRVSFEKHMAKALSTMPELRAKIVRKILALEKDRVPKKREIVREIQNDSEDDHHSRHKINQALEQLKEFYGNMY